MFLTLKLNDSDNNDIDDEWVKGLAWEFHPLRERLLELLISNEIPTSYKEMGPKAVWDKYCGEKVFQGFNYDAAFKRRLLALRKFVAEGKSRALLDRHAFDMARRNHQAPELTSRGEPQWNGSDAQRLLKEDIASNKHIGSKPEALWWSRDEYQQFYLTTFRSHLQQEERTKKYLHTLEYRDEERKKKREEEAKERLLRTKKKKEAELEKKLREEEKAAERAEKKRIAAEKAMAKEAEKAAKAAARAEKKRIAAEKAKAKEVEKVAKAAARAEKKRIADEKAKAKAAARQAK